MCLAGTGARGASKGRERADANKARHSKSSRRKRDTSPDTSASEEERSPPRRKRKAKKQARDSSTSPRRSKKRRGASTWDLLAHLWPVHQRPADFQKPEVVNR